MNSRDYRTIARNNLAGNWGNAVLAALVALILGGLVAGGGVNYRITINENESIHFAVHYGTFYRVSFLGLVQFIIGGVIRQGYAVYLIKQHDHREPPALNDLFSQFHRFGDGFCLALLQGLYIFLWGLLLIIPGIVASYRYAMAPFIMAENPNMTASEAIVASKEMMDGHKMELFLLDLSFLGWILLSLLTAGIGVLWLNPYINAAHTVFYRSICHRPVTE